MVRRVFALLFTTILGLFLFIVECQAGCPPRCLCHRNQQLRTVMCARQGLETFPRNISDIVEHLDLSSNLLTEISDDINRLTDLQYLNLAKNRLASLPDDLSQLKALRRLDLTGNNVEQVGKISSISHLTSLTVLYLSRNPIIDLTGLSSGVLQALDASYCLIEVLTGASLEGIPTLTSLNLAGNPLKAIDGASSEKLRWLDASNCQLNYLEPETFIRFPELEDLRLSDNPRLVYSTRRSTLKHFKLKRLDASRCNLDRPGLHGLPQLLQARLSRNSIHLLPDRIFFRNRQLTHLYLNANGIENLNTSTFVGLVKLQVLDLSANSLEDIPQLTFQDNVELRFLNLSYNALSHFPNLTTLVSSVDLSSNLIASMKKDSLFDMPGVRVLTLNDNQLETIPDEIQSSTLNILNLRRNRLVQLGNRSLIELPELQKIDLSGNRLTEAMRPEAFRNNPLLNTVRLDDNPWRCDCLELMDTFEFLTDPPAKTLGSDMICQSPGNVSGYSWESACFDEWHGALYYNKDRTWGLVLISLLTVVIVAGSVVSIRHTMKVKRRALEQRQELERAEARERLRLLQRRNQRLEEELLDRPPEPRIHPLELIGPPTYEEAVQMPRLVQSLDALNEISVENIAMRSLGSVDNLRAKKRRSRRPKKRTQSEDDLLKRQERREVRRRRARNNSTGSICETIEQNHQHPHQAQNSNHQPRVQRLSTNSSRRNRRQSVLEDQQDSGSSSRGGRPRPPTPNTKKKRRRDMVRDGHSTDDEDSEVQIFRLSRSLVLREFRREPRSGYRERAVEEES